MQLPILSAGWSPTDTGVQRSTRRAKSFLPTRAQPGEVAQLGAIPFFGMHPQSWSHRICTGLSQTSSRTTTLEQDTQGMFKGPRGSQMPLSWVLQHPPIAENSPAQSKTACNPCWARTKGSFLACNQVFLTPTLVKGEKAKSTWAEVCHVLPHCQVP